jgi:hypothetical protein
MEFHSNYTSVIKGDLFSILMSIIIISSRQVVTIIMMIIIIDTIDVI